jgi:hypothetical protein
MTQLANDAATEASFAISDRRGADKERSEFNRTSIRKVINASTERRQELWGGHGALDTFTRRLFPQ